jgi:hypothetical protein
MLAVSFLLPHPCTVHGLSEVTVINEVVRLLREGHRELQYAYLSSFWIFLALLCRRTPAFQSLKQLQRC